MNDRLAFTVISLKTEVKKLNNIKTIFAFSLGAAIGSIITWKLIKTKYEQIAQEEIDSVKEVFSKKHKELEEEKIKNPNYDRYAAVLKRENYSSNNEQKGGSEPMENSKPCIITPEEFGEDGDYEIISLNYYEDEVLTDDVDDVIYDWENTVGEDFPDHFGEYEDDSVFVRNDRLKCYYEILKDCRNYSDLHPNLTVEE